MKRILFICIIIIILIVIGDIFFQRKIDKTFDYMISQLKELDDMDDNNLRKEKINEMDSFWEQYSTSFSCYIEHAELEKIQSQYVVIKAGIEIYDNAYVHEEINRTINIISLIKDKKTLRIDNIM